MSAVAPCGRERFATRRQQRRPEGRLWKKLQSPFSLVVQGFLLGGILFFTLDPFAEPAPVPSGGGSMLSNLQV